MDLGSLPPFQRARQNFGSGRVRITRPPRAGLLPPLLPVLRRASPLARYRRLDPRRDDDQDCHDWAQWDERPMTVPTAPVRVLLIGGPRSRVDRR